MEEAFLLYRVNLLLLLRIKGYPFPTTGTLMAIM